MITIRERNQQILRMRQDGVAHSEVARRFNLSRSRIAIIEQEFEAESAMAEKRARIREELRAADNPDKMWATVDLIDALRLSVLFRRRLLEHFDKIGKREMSWRDLVSLLIPAPTRWGTMSRPLFEVFGMGKKGFNAVTEQINEMTLGPRCNKERMRMERPAPPLPSQ